MATKDLGAVTAYAYAVNHGYTGTEAQFEEAVGSLPGAVADAQAAVTTVETIGAEATQVPTTTPAAASYNPTTNKITFSIPEGNGITSITHTGTSGSVKTYTILFDDGTSTTFDVTDGEVTDEALAETLENYAKIDGRYIDLTSGTALQLESTVRENDQTPYVFRTSGGSVDIGDREYINGIVGGTVAWNQLISKTMTPVKYQSSAESTVTVDHDTGVITAFLAPQASATTARWHYSYSQTNLNGHVIMSSAKVLADTNCSYWAVHEINRGKVDIVANTARYVQVISKPSYSGTIALGGMFSDLTDAGVNTTISDYNVFDLTQMFGSTIADYIYALETAHTGDGIAYFKKLFPKPYYEYNAGELKSVEGLVSHDMTGFNQWDEEWKAGHLVTGEEVSDGTYRLISKNYIPVIPNTTYCFTAPKDKGVTIYAYDANKVYTSGNILYDGNRTGHSYTTFNVPDGFYYIRFQMYAAYGTGSDLTYKNDICINIAWDNSRNGEYESYELYSYPLDSTKVLRGVFKLDANNNLYADGDIYPPSGEFQRRYRELNMENASSITVGTTAGGVHYADIKFGVGTTHPYLADQNAPCVSTKYEFVPISTTGASGMIKVYAAAVTVYDDRFTDATTATSLLTSEDFRCVYKLATPTEETADLYTNPQIVNDFGTEEYVFGDSAFPIPVGHNTFYPVDLKAKVEMAPNSPDGDGDYIVRQTNGMNEYVPLIIEDALPQIPSTAGSYKLIVTVVDGSDPVLSWEAQS